MIWAIMTKQGKYNLLAMVGLPAAAVVGAWLSGQSGVWAPYSATYIWLAQTNFIMMLLFGIISGLLLLWSRGEKSRWFAILPTVVMAGSGAATYIFYGLFPADVAAGAEYLGTPQYLAVIGLGLIFLTLFLRITGIVKRDS